MAKLAANAAQLFPLVALDRADYMRRNTLGKFRRAIGSAEHDWSVKVAEYERDNAEVITRQQDNERAYDTARAAEVKAKTEFRAAESALSAAKSAHADAVKALAASTDPKVEKSLTSARDKAAEAITSAESAVSVARAVKADAFDAMTAVIESGEEIAAEVKRLSKPGELADAITRAEQRSEEIEDLYNELRDVISEVRTGERELSAEEISATRARLGLPAMGKDGKPTVITWDHAYGLNAENLSYWRDRFNLSGLDRGTKIKRMG